MQDLKAKTIRGGLARLCAQGANFLLRMGSLIVLARLLDPRDFGLVGMVTVFTGVLGLFRDFGLSAAAVQRTVVTEEQISALFWINILVGVLLGLVALAMAPAIAAFYHDPQLFWVTAVLATGVHFQCSRSTTFSTSPTPDEFYRLGGDKRRLLDCGYYHRHCRRQSWLRILGPCSDVGHTTTYCHYRFMADRELGPGDASQLGWDSFYDAFWRHSYFEWPRSLCRL